MTPKAEQDLMQISGAVSDGAAVDWRRLEGTTAAERQRLVLRQLQVVADIARWHASGEAADAHAATWVTPHGASAPPANPAQATPQRWGHLELRERVGTGAFGTVYRAWDTTLQREVALKLLLADPALAAAGADADEAMQEARRLARVRHPNVVVVYGAERNAGRVGLWMEFVHGRTLDDLVRERGAMSAREAALVGQELCRALTAVHRAGLVHRDLKARNVLREDGGRIVLMDFGTGWEREPTEGTRPRIAGTPAYMAPEVLRGEGATPQSDVYALGVLLYYLVTGRFPVEGRSVDELRQAHAMGRVGLLREARSDLPEPYLQVVEKALAADLAHRFASAGQMERALGGALGLGSQAEPEARAASEAAPAPSTPASSRHHTRAVVAWAIVALVAVLGGRFGFRDRGRGHEATPANAVPYTVDARFVRRHGGDVLPLASGGRVAPGDGIGLEITASVPVHVYVVDEDDRGAAYLLFPLPGFEPTNPLATGVRHRLPGVRAGQQLDWQVSSAGGQEHLLIVASPTRLADFEAELLALPQAAAGAGAPAVQLTERAKLRLRGIGGLQASGAETPATPARRLSDLAARLPAGAEKVQGVWVRQVEFENPAAAKE